MFPRALYLWQTKLTGELDEYLENASVKKANNDSKFQHEDYRGHEREWFDRLSRYMMRWVAAHRHGEQDTWTSVRHPEAIKNS